MHLNYNFRILVFVLMPYADLCVTVRFHMLVPQCPECLIPRLNWMTQNEIVYG